MRIEQNTDSNDGELEDRNQTQFSDDPYLATQMSS